MGSTLSIQKAVGSSKIKKSSRARGTAKSQHVGSSIIQQPTCQEQNTSVDTQTRIQPRLSPRFSCLSYPFGILPRELRQQIWSKVIGGHEIQLLEKHKCHLVCGRALTGGCSMGKRCGRLACKWGDLLQLLFTCKQM